MDALIAFKFGFNNDLIFNLFAISKISFLFSAFISSGI